jgi:hypothetical protein
MSDLIKRLRHADTPGAKPSVLDVLTSEAADLIEQQAARIAELEARAGEPVAYFVNDNQPGMKPHYSQISDEFKHHKDVFAFYTHPPTGDAAGKDSVDAALLDWLDSTNRPLQMGWRVTVAPAGNVSIGSVIQLGGKITSIREAISAAIASLTKTADGEKQS